MAKPIEYKRCWACTLRIRKSRIKYTITAKNRSDLKKLFDDMCWPFYPNLCGKVDIKKVK